MILVISVADISIVAILVTAATAVAAFGGKFEGLDFIVNQAVNRGYICLWNSCLFIRGLYLLDWIK